MLQSGFEATSLDVLVDTRTETVTNLLQATAGVHGELQAVVQDVARQLDVPIAAVNLVREDAVLVAAATGLSGWVAEARAIPAGWAVCPRVVNPDRALLVDDLHSEQWGAFPASSIFGPFRAYAGVPLHVQGSVVGTLCAMAPSPKAFDDGTVTVLEDWGSLAVKLLHRTTSPRARGASNR
ncbi:GAF domain-containing protein [Actinoplanes sp. NPDC024001]|uniref:GAF domain-containing protein n=1 Tax=Actinoplanes sp. NPDC024001 TaxID=3154598 RepID=UPI0033EC3A5C